jgi:site-specific DNA-methyltransferase (adenine-specific)
MVQEARMSTADLRLGAWQDVLADVECDAWITDAPYSDRTHAAYRGDGGVVHESGRRDIDYASLSPDAVREIVASWAPRTRGWMVSITDTVLAPAWMDAMDSTGRYVFSPVAWYAPGSRVRLQGDGPAQWSCWIVVSRPRCAPYSKWGALPGGYLCSGDRTGIVTGGKPIALMRALVRDYSRPGDVVCDPFAGGATTLVAALAEGRSAIGAEVDPDTHAAALARLQGIRGPMEQGALF